MLFGNIDTFLIWKLTGGADGGIHVTDVTNASRTQLMNLETFDWDNEITNAFGIPRAMLPRICSSSEVYGHARDGRLAACPLPAIWATNRPRWWGKPVSSPAKPRIPMAPAASCC